MAEDKNSFILYKDLIHTVKKMPKDKQADLFMHILEYVNDLDPQTDDLLVELTFEPVKQSLKRDLRKYEKIKEKNKENALKRWGKKDATACDRMQSDAKHADSDSVSVSVSDSDSVSDILLKKVTKHDDEATEIFSDETNNAKNFLKTEKKIQMDRLKMKYNFSPEDLHLKIDEFIEKKFDWGETQWKDNHEMAKNFELWLPTNHKIIVNNFKSWTDKEFHAECRKFEKEFGKVLLTDFYRYWNQPTETGEMRFQEKNAWDTENQLKIWRSRNGK